MIQNISFHNFRGFWNLELPELAPITLITGGKNVGKSTILEGIFLLATHNDPMCFAKICNFRELPVIPDFDILWKPLFNQLNTDEPIQISACLENDIELTYYRDEVQPQTFYPYKEMSFEEVAKHMHSARSSYTLEFQFTQKETSYKETGRFIANNDGIHLNIDTSLPNNQTISMPLMQIINTRIADIVSPVEMFGEVVLDGRKNDILKILDQVDHVLSDITTITTNGQTLLYGNEGGTMLLPMHLFGTGINKMLFIMLNIMANPNSIILIDEIENGFNDFLYPVIWNAIINAAKENNCQIIATTNSNEYISCALNEIKKSDMKNRFCFLKITYYVDGHHAYQIPLDCKIIK